MKIIFGLLLISVFTSCGGKAPRIDGDSTGTHAAGRSIPIIVSGMAKDSAKGASFQLIPAETNLSADDKICLEQLSKTLELAGYKRAATADLASLFIDVDFPKTQKATGFNIVAIMGGYKHQVALQARDKQKNILWDLKAYANSEFDNRREIFPLIFVGIIDQFGHSINGEDTVHVSEYDTRIEKIQPKEEKKP